MTSDTQPANTGCRAYTVEDIAEILGIGRSSAYSLVKQNHFKIVRIGKNIRISRKSFDDWFENQNTRMAVD